MGQIIRVLIEHEEDGVCKTFALKEQVDHARRPAFEVGILLAEAICAISSMWGMWTLAEAVVLLAQLLPNEARPADELETCFVVAAQHLAECRQVQECAREERLCRGQREGTA